ncbi:AraC family transcriptional regulator [Piscinibacter terrae]|uniref:AraC family transcriptional regulator n=1 Tax=Piscinibacter terrae TaxID=2496871 RepID=A0A3N7I084_9BURK|nr:AraC family transcriptional regulator [Albitalea terrae]RQP26781.1 AraC family transcriptional regulator [Albitalea terrae]
MPQAPAHRSRVFASPWAGVFGTHIDSARHYGRHSHATYGFGLIEDGAQRSASGRGRVDAVAGDVITTNPGEVHDGQPLGGPSRRWRMVYLQPQALAALLGQSCDGVEITQPVIHDPLLHAALRKLLDGMESGPVGDLSLLAGEESLVHALGRLMNSHSTARPEPSVAADMRRVRQRLADDWLNAPSLAELASIDGLSRYQVLRRFQKTFGVPPHAWLLQHRAEHAWNLIQAGTGLAEAAASCGFADQSHMTRIFTRHFGFTPGAWQRAVAVQALQ